MAIYVVRERASRELRGERVGAGKGGGLAGRRMDLDAEWRQGDSGIARQRERRRLGAERRGRCWKGDRRGRGSGVSTDKYHAISLCAPRREHKHRAAPFVST